MSDFLLRLLQRSRGELTALRPARAHPFSAQEMSANAPDAPDLSADPPEQVDVLDRAGALPRTSVPRLPASDLVDTFSRPASFQSRRASVPRHAADSYTERADPIDIFEPGAPGAAGSKVTTDSSPMAPTQSLAAAVSASAPPVRVNRLEPARLGSQLNSELPTPGTTTTTAAATAGSASALPLDRNAIPASTHGEPAGPEQALRLEEKTGPAFLPAPQTPASLARPADRIDERSDKKPDAGRAPQLPHDAPLVRPASYAHAAGVAPAGAEDGGFSSVTVTIGAVHIRPSPTPTPAEPPVSVRQQMPVAVRRGASINDYLRLREDGAL